MIEIAGGIILAVLFFAFFPFILMLAIWIVGIGLLIALCIGIYFGLLNYVSTDTANVIVFFTALISFLIYNRKCLYEELTSLPEVKRSFYTPIITDNEVKKSFYIPIITDTFNKRKTSLEAFLLKKDGIKSVIFNKVGKDYGEFIVVFNTNKISYEDIEIIINKLHLK